MPKIQLSRADAMKVKQAIAQAEANMASTNERIGNLFAAYARQAKEVEKKQQDVIEEYYQLRIKLAKGEASPEEMFHRMMRDGLINPQTGEFMPHKLAEQAREELRVKAVDPSTELMKNVSKHFKDTEANIRDVASSSMEDQPPPK
jgi:multidrug resistance efflux pump